MSWETGTATDYEDLANKLDTFLKTNGSGFGLTYAGTGNGTLTAHRGGASSVAETFTITATSATNWTVVGSVSGSIGPATTGTPFSHAKVAFTITAGGTAFVAGDVFVLATAQKWTNMRLARGSTVLGSSGNSGQLAAENLIDGKLVADSTRLWNPGVTGTEDNVQFTFFASTTIVEIAIRIGSWSAATTQVIFERWDGAAWQSLINQSGLSWSSGEEKVLAVGSPVAATLHRLRMIGGSGTRTVDSVKLRTATGSYNAAMGQMIWKAPGNDGDSEIYCGIHHLRRVDVDYFNWEVASFDGFASTVEFHQQVGYHGRRYLPLWNSSIPYWFIANGRRAIVIAKINTQYEMSILGQGWKPYFTPNQMPYPNILGAPIALGPFDATGPYWNNAGFRYSNSANTHRNPPFSDPVSGTDPIDVHKHHLSVRKLDGTWAGLEGARNDALATPGPLVNQIWPYRSDLSNMDPNIDGSYSLFPIMLNMADPNTLGELDGIVAVTGQGLTAETLIRVGAIDYMVVPNVFRSDRNDFCAVALD